MTYDFGNLESVMEGKHRPGHFQGVAEVVRILFEIVRPDKAYFGEKDFQQLKIIEAMVKQFQFAVDIIPCPVIRESDGLAMSSRNARLSEDERKAAPFIYAQLLWCKKNYKHFSPSKLKNHIEDEFMNHPLFQLEYIEIAESKHLDLIHEWNDTQQARVFIAARLGSVRLIDNIVLF
jgi:pantoate--beta-alanine ligase